MQRLLKPSNLWIALDEAGIASFSYAARWIKTQEDRGNIVYKRKNWTQRRYTANQIKEIVEAFKPGGVGFWKL